MSGAKRPKLPAPPYEKTKLPGGWKRLVEIWEHLRTRNADGYLPKIGGVLAKLAGGPGLPVPPACHGTTCSPFSATVIGVAFDPKYPRKDLDGDPYVPMFNGGKDPLTPFSKFYSRHQENGKSVASVIEYGLGRAIEPAELRRGDLVEIDWCNGGGHTVFCWDAHLDAKGQVDAIQLIGSNGPRPGVSIHGCKDERWIVGDNATIKTEWVEVSDKKDPTKKKQKARNSYESRGNLKKAKEEIFVDGDEVVQTGDWFALPGVKSVDLGTFRARPKPILYSGATKSGFTIRKVHCARFHYDGDPPAPYAMKNGPPPPATKPGHTEAPAVVVKGADREADPHAPQKVPPKPAKQEKDKTVEWQHHVEVALQAFHAAKWIESDPGKSADINDAKTRAALEELQKKFKLKPDSHIGPKTLRAIDKQLAACQSQHEAQRLLAKLYAGKKLKSDPGAPDGTNHAKTRAAVLEFQQANGLPVTSVPDAATLERLHEVVDGHAPTAEKPGLSPEVRHLYWVGNFVDVGGTAKLRLHSKDLKTCEVCTIHLEDTAGKKQVDASVKLSVDGEEAEASVPIPFGAGASVLARVVTQSAGEIATSAPVYVGALTEGAGWRPYIGKDSLPDDVVEVIRKNRARYPKKDLPLAAGKWAGKHHYDYKPPKAHGAWAQEYAKKRIDAAKDNVEKHVAQAFLVLLSREGRFASMQSYDDQIVTWGVGLGAMGDGVHAFEHMNADPRMKRLLDDLGINYDAGAYNVVDLGAKKVVSSTVVETVVKTKKGKRTTKKVNHVAALEAWRQQPDLLSAIIGISEDPATRDAVADSQWKVYLSNSTRWAGQDKIATQALYVLITRMMHWLPAFAKAAVDVEAELRAVGGGVASTENDKKMAPRFVHAFIRQQHAHWAAEHPKKYADVHHRTKANLWKQFRDDAQTEGFDAGDLEYEAGY